MPEYSVNLGLSALPEVSQRENPQVYVEFLRVRNALNLILSSLDTYTGAVTPTSVATPVETTRVQNISKVWAKSGSAISAGQYVYLHDVAGSLTADLALAGVNPAWGFAVSSALAAGEQIQIAFYGVNPYFSGLTLAATYYLSAGTPGAITAVPTAQLVGRALSATDLLSSPL